MPITHHELSIVPKDSSAVLRRYMPADRFKSLLANHELYFGRVDRFSDPFEGSIPRREFEHKFNSARQGYEFYNIPYDEEKIEKEVRDSSEWHRTFRMGYYVNCWNRYEPGIHADAMWRLYLSTNEGIAIQSSVQRLNEAFSHASEKVILSEVRYLDYDGDVFHHSVEFNHKNVNLFVPLIHKRKQFRHENELRLLFEMPGRGEVGYQDKIKSIPGHLVKVDVLKLIEKIILPPTCFDEFAESLETEVRHMGYNFTFERSTLAQPAYF